MNTSEEVNSIVEEINSIVESHFHFEIDIYSYIDGVLILAGSEDSSYYHTLEIRFKDVFAIIGTFSWHVDKRKKFLSIVDDTVELSMNRKYQVTVGNIIFKFTTEDDYDTYIIAEEISMEKKIVKYYE